MLSPEDQTILRTYYLVGEAVLANIFVDRQALLRDQPHIATQAKVVFDKILVTLGIDTFTYTTTV